MTQLTATVLDTTGIQSYIFGSNRLRENIGASYLVSQATEQWAREALIQLGKDEQQPVHAYDPATDSPEPRIHTGNIIGELLYAGGGNTTLLFTNIQYARHFTRLLSRKILKEAPGIQLVAAHQDFDWDNSKKPLHKVFQTLIDTQLPAKKQSQPPSAPLLGLGVTADCQSTQLVAIDTTQSNPEAYKVPKDSKYRISREIAEKLKAVKLANQQLTSTVFKGAPSQYKIPLDFDDFSRAKGDISYIAVVHADGNNMGQRFQTHGQKKGTTDTNYVVAMRELSRSINEAGIQALEAVTTQLVAAIHSNEHGKDTLKTRHGDIVLSDRYLPFRPLVYGGDDVTFVCDGRLGLDLATAYLQAFEAHTAADGQPLRACAGISIVKVHYPFARAYETSEALCQKAKRFVRDICSTENEASFSALDWHIAASGLVGKLSEIRQREYTVEAGDLIMRPVRLCSHKSDWRTWPGFTQVVDQFKESADWKDRRNKIYALREVLRKGDIAVQEFLTTYGLKHLPAFPETNSTEPKTLSAKGWLGERCGYFDAIEALDFYSSLTSTSETDTMTEANND